MKVTLVTEKLQKAVQKVNKGVSNNALLPLTSLLNIKGEDGDLLLTSTDGTNYFTSTIVNGSCEDFELSINADTFIALVNKTTSQLITLSLENDVFKFKGNGTYNFSLPVDENNNIIKFPNNDQEFNIVEPIKKAYISQIIQYNKPALSTSVELPAITNYYCGENVITSDSYKLACTNIKLFKEPMLISSELMDLINIIPDEEINVSINENSILFSGNDDFVYCPIKIDSSNGKQVDLEDFPIVAVKSLIEGDFESSCVVERLAVERLLDRLMLFVSPYDKNAVYLTFTKDGILFSNKNSNGSELVPYISNNNYKEFTCSLNIVMFKSEVSSHNNKNLEIHFGNDTTIKILGNNVIQLLALLVDDRAEEE